MQYIQIELSEMLNKNTRLVRKKAYFADKIQRYHIFLSAQHSQLFPY